MFTVTEILRIVPSRAEDWQVKGLDNKVNGFLKQVIGTNIMEIIIESMAEVSCDA